MATMGMLIDVTYCGGCNDCVAACMKKQGFPGDPKKVKDLSAESRTALLPRGEFTVRKLCRHCVDPSCATACPSDALVRTDYGAVKYEASKCMGCRYCMISCPFGVPAYEWDSLTPKVQKCDMCWDRIEAGKIPACAEACTQEATIFGEREELLKIARERMAEYPEDYDPHICGEHDEGGAAILMIGPPGIGPLRAGDHSEGASHAARPRDFLRSIPGMGVAGSAALAMVWFCRRRDEVKARERKQHQGEEQGPEAMEV